jgi:hypothetical protein
MLIGSECKQKKKKKQKYGSDAVDLDGRSPNKRFRLPSFQSKQEGLDEVGEEYYVQENCY